MKIVFVCNEYPPQPHGGIGTFVQTVARELQRRGHVVTVVGLGEESQKWVDQGIEVFMLRRSNIQYLGNLISRLALRRWLTARVKNGQVDVIEAPDYMGMLPFGVAGCAVVIRLHLSSTSICQQAGRKVPKAISFYERRNLAANTNWIAVSDFVMDLTRKTFGISPKQSMMIHNPVPAIPSDLPEMSELPANFVLYAGQVSRRKGAIVLAEAACTFMALRPDLNLVYVGGGIPQDGDRPIAEQIRETVGPELIDRVHFLGHMDRRKVLACMKRAKLFVFPSRLEALSLVLLEAMSCGLPVVCTNFPPGPEIVEDGVNGLLIDPTLPADISEKITRLLDDPTLARSLTTNAQKTVAERFSLERCIDQTEEFYEQSRKSI